MKAIKSILFFLLFLVSCRSEKDIIGTYKSNRAELGFFITKITFFEKNTFNYEFSGDLQHTELSGNFKKIDDFIYLRFKTNQNEIESKNDSLSVAELLNGNYHTYHLRTENGIDYHLKYKMKGDKLFVHRVDNGKLVKKSKTYSNNRKFVLFGTKWKTRKIYLKKIK